MESRPLHDIYKKRENSLTIEYFKCMWIAQSDISAWLPLYIIIHIYNILEIILKFFSLKNICACFDFVNISISLKFKEIRFHMKQKIHIASYKDKKEYPVY